MESTSVAADIKLLAIVEVPEADRVLCQSPGCGRAVFRRIHVVSVDGVTSVLGSECFRALVGDAREKSFTPRFGTVDGFELTPEDRALLVSNTARFLENLEVDEIEAALARLEALSEPAAVSPSGYSAPAPRVPPAPEPPRVRRTLFSDLNPYQLEDLDKARAQARIELKRRYMIDPTLPGWNGFVDLIAVQMLLNTYNAGSPQQDTLC